MLADLRGVRPGAHISPDRGNHWHPDTKAYNATEACTKILEIKPAAQPPARFAQGIEFRSTVHLLFKFITPPTES